MITHAASRKHYYTVLLDRSRGAPFCYLAAAAVIVAATVVAAAVAAQHIAAAVAEQEDQDDDPANITAAETVIVTHIHYLRKNLQRHLPLIPRYSGGQIWCRKSRCSKTPALGLIVTSTDRQDIFPQR